MHLPHPAQRAHNDERHAIIIITIFFLFFFRMREIDSKFTGLSQADGEIVPLDVF